MIAPPVLLLDEPLSHLDAKLREEMQFELRRIQRKVGTTTIMVTPMRRMPTPMTIMGTSRPSLPPPARARPK